MVTKYTGSIYTKSDIKEMSEDMLTTNSNAKKFNLKGTSNTLCGDYGDKDAGTRYKYYSIAINSIDSEDTIIAARMYAVVDGITCYGKYVTTNDTVCATTLAEVAAMANS